MVISMLCNYHHDVLYFIFCTVGEFGLGSSNHMEQSSTTGMSSWPPKTDLAELFSHIGLGKYTDLFSQQEVSSIHSSTVLYRVLLTKKGT